MLFLKIKIVTRPFFHFLLPYLESHSLQKHEMSLIITYQSYMSKFRLELCDFRKYVPFSAQNACRVRFFLKIHTKYWIFRYLSHKNRTLLDICALNEGVFLKWIATPSADGLFHRAQGNRR